MLGLIPDSQQMEAKARAQRCETLTIAAAAMIRGNQWPQLNAVMQTMVMRDDQLLSIGLRNKSGYLRVDSGRHRDLWTRAQKDNTLMMINVPVTLNKSAWGDVEFCFTAPGGGGITGIVTHPTFRLVGYFFSAGLFVYTFFVARILGVFNGVQVVPDRVRQALDTLAEGLLVLDEKERIILANGAFCKTVGIEAEDLNGRLAGSLNWVVNDDHASVREFPWSRAMSDASSQTDQMLRYRLDDDREFIFSINSAPIEASDGSHRGALVTLRDVTHIEEHRAELETMLAMLRNSRDEITRKNRELEILATQDALTGCLNRRAFFDRFGIAFQFSKQTQSPLACIMVDNDHFKSVNDTYGHHIGDEVLRRVAATLQMLHGQQHLVCRYGGEEFCILLPGLDLSEAAEAAERIRQAIMDIRLDDPAELRLAASLGVSELSLGAADPQAMINQADVCLYMAKRGGRNRVVCYEESFALVEIDDAKVARTKSTPEPTKEGTAIPFNAVSALLSALAYRDTETAEHSRRVADLCVLVANGLLDQSQTLILETAALLHDIGKIGVPDNILLKPGPLTDDEWQVMARHDRIGVEIVANAFDCEALSETIRTHHAHFGGNLDHGLPSGTNIVIYARILTIADSYDAMVSDRVYRKGRSHEDAIAELQHCANQQFDPVLVERFIAATANGPRKRPTDAFVVEKSLAIQIGQQIERLAQAIDAQDVKSLSVLASRLGDVARHHHVDPIADVAKRIELGAANEDVQWFNLLRDTQELMVLCRETQNAFFPKHVKIK